MWYNVVTMRAAFLDNLLKDVRLPLLPSNPEESDFRARSLVLDAALMASPEAQAQKIQAVLLKRMRIDTPWLVPNLTLTQ